MHHRAVIAQILRGPGDAQAEIGAVDGNQRALLGPGCLDIGLGIIQTTGSKARIHVLHLLSPLT